MLLRCRIPLANFELNIDVSFDTRVTAIFGPSGSGKTTLARRHRRPARYRRRRDRDRWQSAFFFRAKDQSSATAKRRRLRASGRRAVSASFRATKYSVRRRAQKPIQPQPHQNGSCIRRPGNRHLVDRPVTKLSGGEAQRVALARAILSQPRLFLLDEPLAALDIGLKEKILPYLGRVRDEFDIPMIYVTHNLTEVLTLADWVLMIQQGQLITQGVPKTGAAIVSCDC